MKTRLILSAITLFLDGIAQGTFKFFYSPITGVATAQSLNDDVASYGMAKFIREGGVEQTLLWITFLVLFFIWLSPICRIFGWNKKN